MEMKSCCEVISKRGIVHINKFNNEMLLHFAAMYGHLSCMKILISDGLDINEKNEYGKTPLHFAAVCNRLECMEFLISLDGTGKNINDEDINGETPLDLLSEENKIKIKECIKKMEEEDPLIVKGVVEDF